jgi:hypothetical protein
VVIAQATGKEINVMNWKPIVVAAIAVLTVALKEFERKDS